MKKWTWVTRESDLNTLFKVSKTSAVDDNLHQQICSTAKKELLKQTGSVCNLFRLYIINKSIIGFKEIKAIIEK